MCVDISTAHHMLTMSYSKNPHNPVMSPLPQPLPTSGPPGSHLMSLGRHLRALGTVTAWGRKNRMRSEPTRDETKGGAMGWLISPMGSHLHYPRVSEITPYILTFSL